MSREGSHCICLSLILMDSDFKTGKNYYQEMCLEECKLIFKEKKLIRYITVDI